MMMNIMLALLTLDLSAFRYHNNAITISVAIQCSSRCQAQCCLSSVLNCDCKTTGVDTAVARDEARRGGKKGAP